MEIAQESSAKLLGVTMDENQKWNSRIYGKGGTLSSLNSRMFIIKRIQNHVGKESFKKVVDSLYTSKLRYGLPLFGKVKWNIKDTQEKWLTDLQLNQSKMLRYIDRVPYSFNRGIFSGLQSLLALYLFTMMPERLGT